MLHSIFWEQVFGLIWNFISSLGGPHRGYTACTEAFLFSLVNPLGLGSTKLPLKDSYQQLSAIKCHSDYGPTFGNGHDLSITGRHGSLYLDCSYRCPPDLGDQQRRFFTGSGRFQITNYEVFGIRHWLDDKQKTGIYNIREVFCINTSFYTIPNHRFFEK